VAPGSTLGNAQANSDSCKSTVLLLLIFVFFL